MRVAHALEQFRVAAQLFQRGRERRRAIEQRLPDRDQQPHTQHRVQTRQQAQRQITVFGGPERHRDADREHQHRQRQEQQGGEGHAQQLQQPRLFIRRLQSQQLQTRAQQPDQAGGDAKYRFTQTHESWRDHADGRTMRPGRHASRAVPVSGG